ncbi:STAS domain-containing protein [Saccharothrix sp. MB29]|nr:STAS domain-containing protein [Saccharothrix sp. MB29]
MTGSEHRGGHVEQLRVERVDRDEAVVVSAHGEVDGTNAPVLHEGLTAAFAAAAARTVPVVVDLTDVPFFASSGMALLVEHHKLGDRRATPLRVVAPARSPSARCAPPGSTRCSTSTPTSGRPRRGSRPCPVVRDDAGPGGPPGSGGAGPDEWWSGQVVAGQAGRARAGRAVGVRRGVAGRSARAGGVRPGRGRLRRRPVAAAARPGPGPRAPAGPRWRDDLAPLPAPRVLRGPAAGGASPTGPRSSRTTARATRATCPPRTDEFRRGPGLPRRSPTRAARPVRRRPRPPGFR